MYTYSLFPQHFVELHIQFFDRIEYRCRASQMLIDQQAQIEN